MGTCFCGILIVFKVLITNKAIINIRKSIELILRRTIIKENNLIFNSMGYKMVLDLSGKNANIDSLKVYVEKKTG